MPACAGYESRGAPGRAAPYLALDEVFCRWTGRGGNCDSDCRAARQWPQWYRRLKIRMSNPSPQAVSGRGSSSGISNQENRRASRKAMEAHFEAHLAQLSVRSEVQP